MNYFKKLCYLTVCVFLLTLTACEDDDDKLKTYEVSIQLVYPNDAAIEPIADVKVTLKNANEYVFEAVTDKDGVAKFEVPTGLYEAAANEKRALEGTLFLLNGIKSNIQVGSDWNPAAVVNVEMTKSEKSQVIIKELYLGGITNEDGRSYLYDRYVILYNNSDQVAVLEDLCLGAAIPANSNQTNRDYDVNGKLFYEAEGWIPAGHSIWHLPRTLTMEPYSQTVIVLGAAIDHSAVYPESVNLANSSYYVTYAPESGFTHASWYPAPYSGISTTQYFDGYMYGLGNGWAALSSTGPTFFIFTLKNTDPTTFVNDVALDNYHGGGSSQSNLRKKVPVEWVIDGVEVFRADATDNNKRLTPAVDGGYVYLINTKGYSNYRNVDKEATEAIEDNVGKLVYNYNLGVEVNGSPSTDPSGIDAEASMKNGAKIIYLDTNNSSNDFHLRGKVSLK